jgi:hypothetical protein
VTDNPKKKGEDAKRVASEQPYEVSYFARKHGIRTADARDIILKHGPSREACDAAAKKRR